MTKDTPITAALWLVAILAALVLLITFREPTSVHAKIGGTEVPVSLHCEEDEVIAFDASKPGPRPLTCVHIDSIGG